MRTVDGHTGIGVLEREDCVRLLGADVIGRIAVVEGGAPIVFPVNYALDGETVIFRTAPGTKLSAGPRAKACFEVDGFDRAAMTGWSVAAVGRLEELDEYASEAFDRARALAITPWAGPGRDHWMRLTPTRITGRYVGKKP